MKHISVLAVFLFFSLAARAQETPSAPPKQEASTATAEDARMKALEEQVSTLAGEVALLRGELQQLRGTSAPQTAAQPVSQAVAQAEPGAAVTPPATPTYAPAPAGPQTFGGASGNAKLLNPDISLIGDFIGIAGHNDVSPGKSLEMHESELGVQAIIDPYARADAFISFGETGVNVEEAYVTFTSLPAGLLLKVGKKRADFGKVNTIHNHALQFIDRSANPNFSTVPADNEEEKTRQAGFSGVAR